MKARKELIENNVPSHVRFIKEFNFEDYFKTNNTDFISSKDLYIIYLDDRSSSKKEKCGSKTFYVQVKKLCKRILRKGYYLIVGLL